MNKVNYAALIYPPDLTIGDLSKPKLKIKELGVKLKLLSQMHGIDKYKKNEDAINKEKIK